jgi:ferredoxin
MAAGPARPDPARPAAPGEPAIVFRGRRYPALAGQDILGQLLEGGSDILYLCMGGSCGTCEVRVLSGGEHLEPANEAELEHFAGAAGAKRLACQAYCRATGDVVIEQRIGTRI